MKLRWKPLSAPAREKGAFPAAFVADMKAALRSLVEGSGFARQYWRIREALEQMQLHIIDVQELISEESLAEGKEPIHYLPVWVTIRGLKNDRRTLRFLIKLSIPLEYLDLPKDLQAEVRDGKKKREVA